MNNHFNRCTAVPWYSGTLTTFSAIFYYTKNINLLNYRQFQKVSDTKSALKTLLFAFFTPKNTSKNTYFASKNDKNAPFYAFKQQK